MDKRDIKVIKQNIIKCLTEPDENGNILFREVDYYNPNKPLDKNKFRVTDSNDTRYECDSMLLTALMDNIVKAYIYHWMKQTKSKGK